MVKNLPANAGDIRDMDSIPRSGAYNVGDPGLIPGWGRSSGEGNGTPLQYSCLENPMDREVWRVTVHGVQSQTRLKRHSMHVSSFIQQYFLSLYYVLDNMSLAINSMSIIGERNGNPLQCSCLENPRDGGAWWAAVSGVAQSRTRLKQLSSSSSNSSGSMSINLVL